LGHRVAVSFKGTVDNVGTVVVHVGYHWLVHGAIPLHVARLSVTISVHVLVRQVEHRVLASSPFAVCIWHGRVLGQNTSHRPVEQVGVIGQGLGVKRVIIQANGPVVTETLTERSNDKVGDPDVSETTARIEIFDWKLSDKGETEETTNLSTGSVVCPIKV